MFVVSCKTSILNTGFVWETEIGHRQVQHSVVEHLQVQGLPLRGSDQDLHQDLAVRILSPERLLCSHFQKESHDCEVRVQWVGAEEWVQSASDSYQLI